MPEYLYTARDRAGRSQTGKRAGETPARVTASLRAQGLQVLSLEPVREKEGSESSGLLGSLQPSQWLPVRSMDVEMGLQQISVLLRSGLTLLTALEAAEEQSNRPAMGRIWREVSSDIQRGSSFAGALENQTVFHRLVIQLSRVGEQTGELATVLARASEILQRRRLIRNNILTALMYPVIVFVLAIAVTVFMMIFLIPKLESFLGKMDKKLPAMTQALVDTSRFMHANILGASIVTLLVAAVLVAVYLWQPGRYWIDRYSLRLPVVGNIFRLSGTIFFSQSMYIMLHSGVGLVESLRTSEGLHKNLYLQDVLQRARRQVVEGGSLASGLSEAGGYLPMLHRMASIGESSGTLDEMLSEVYKYYEAQLQSVIKQFSTLIEPVVIVFVGGLVGFVYVSFFLALFSASTGGSSF